MQPRPRRILLSLSLLALFCFAPEASADPVAVTSGWITFKSGNRDFQLEGNGFFIRGTANESFLPGLTPDMSQGERAELGNAFLDDDLLLPQGPFTIGGFNYPQYLFLNDHFRLTITADSFDFPTDPSVTSVTFSSTFTMDGVLWLHPLLQPNAQNYDLTGQGVATAVYKRAPGFPVWALQSLSYTFQAPATPTPEPATLLLLGTGLAGAAARAYRRRKRG